jgi:hypothetical protein
MQEYKLVRYGKKPMPGRRPSYTEINIADPGCLFRIPDPDFYPLRIPDPTTAPKEDGKKKCLCYLFCSHTYHKIVNCFIFEQVKETFLAKILGIAVLLSKQLSLSYQKYRFGIRDRRSGKTYSGKQQKFVQYSRKGPKGTQVTTGQFP